MNTSPTPLDETIQAIMWAVFSYADKREAFTAAPPGEPRHIARRVLATQEQYIRERLRALLAPSETKENKAHELLVRLRKLNIIFPSMCANNGDAYTFLIDLKEYLGEKVE